MALLYQHPHPGAPAGAGAAAAGNVDHHGTERPGAAGSASVR